MSWELLLNPTVLLVLVLSMQSYAVMTGVIGEGDAQKVNQRSVNAPKESKVSGKIRMRMGQLHMYIVKEVISKK